MDDYSQFSGFGIVEGTAFHPLVLKAKVPLAIFKRFIRKRQDGRLINT